NCAHETAHREFLPSFLLCILNLNSCLFFANGPRFPVVITVPPCCLLQRSEL
ncbi:hypothetical protein SISSUDRAFT_1054795, partial [Sistotremastrum suecicum HHB10207 ss-3]